MRFIRTLCSGPFDARAKTLQKARAALSPTASNYDYLRDLIGSQLVERLSDINRTFPQALDFHCGAAHFHTALHDSPAILSKAGIQSLHHVDVHAAILQRAREKCVQNATDIQTTFATTDDAMDISPRYDLIVSAASLHWQNDLRATFRLFSELLRPDGALLIAMPGLNTLQELRIALQLAETNLLNRLAPRVSPTIRPPDAAALLHATPGLVMPTVDVERITVPYKDIWAVMRHLRGMGESNALKAREAFLRRDVIQEAAKIYEDKFAAQHHGATALHLTFDIVHMIAWKKAHTHRTNTTHPTSESVSSSSSPR